jgi:hypothetical protein
VLSLRSQQQRLTVDGADVCIGRKQINCFKHESIPAMGICQACGKALCSHCALQLPNGIACKHACEKRFNVVNPAIDSTGAESRPTNLQIKMSRVVVAIYSFAILALIVPILFAASIVCGLCFLGLALAVISVMMFRRRRRFPYT